MSFGGVCPFCKQPVKPSETRCSRCGFQIRLEVEEGEVKQKKDKWSLPIWFFSTLSVFGVGVLLYHKIVSEISTIFEAIGMFSLIVGILGLLTSKLNQWFG